MKPKNSSKIAFESKKMTDFLSMILSIAPYFNNSKNKPLLLLNSSSQHLLPCHQKMQYNHLNNKYLSKTNRSHNSNQQKRKMYHNNHNNNTIKVFQIKTSIQILCIIKCNNNSNNNKCQVKTE
jgi:hypothetical protein